MWFRSLFYSSNRPRSRKTTRSARRAADRRGEARRLFLEPLEDRSLMAFNLFGQYATGASPLDATLAPIDAGSQPDLVVVNTGDNSVGVRLGNADGTFGSLQISPTGAGPRSLATGDFTGDGVTDVATANAADVSLLNGNGDGTFAALASISLPAEIAPTNPDPAPLPQSPLSVATGDLNADGKLDLVVAGQTSFSVYGQFYSCNYFGCYSSGVWQTYTDGYVNVLIGNGSGGFGPAEVHPLGAGRTPAGVAVADINGDGKADVMTANYGDLSVLLGNGGGSVGSPINSGSGIALPSISLGDVDGDGKVDTLLGSGGGLSVQKGDGLGGFTAQPFVNPSVYSATSGVMGDVNADGKIDLVTARAINNYTCTSSGYFGCYSGYNTTTSQATVLLGNGLGNFALPLTSSLGGDLGLGYLADLGIADLNGDARPDLVAIDTSAGKAIVATNNSDWNPPPAFAISDAPTIVEGNSGTVNAVFTVSIVGAHSGNVSVNYATADNGATAGADYTATSGTLTFGPSDSTMTITVPVKGDTLNEYDEQFYVNLSNAVGAQITDSQGTGTIQDDDAAPLVTINDVSKKEGNKNYTSFVFTVGLSAPSGKWVSVNFATADGTAMVSDSDYLGTSGNVSFAPGVTTVTITVTVLGDTKKEANETFFVNLSGATNATISDSQGLGTIVNDDGRGGGGGKAKPNSANIDLALLTDTLTTTGKRK
jgi:Calx-beta domain-containing protein/VCBS repeat protein